MSEEMAVNGVSSDVDLEGPVPEEDSDNASTNSSIQNLMQKIAVLEQEKRQLINGKQSAMGKIKQLEREIGRAKSDKKTLALIAARAAELETEVSRLQHDLIMSITEAQEANVELSELKREVEGLKKSKSEKGEMIVIIEKERNLLLERLNKEAEKMKVAESRFCELEKKIHGFEARESGKKGERFQDEEEAKVKISEKDDQIRSLKRMIDDLQSVIAKNRVDMERLKKDKDELEIVKNDLEALLKKSERKVKEMEHKIDQLHKRLEEQEKLNNILREKMVRANGMGAAVNRGVVVNGDETRLMGLKLEWPVVATTAGAIATVAVVYLRYAKI